MATNKMIMYNKRNKIDLSIDKMYKQLVKEVEYSKNQIASGKCKTMTIENFKEKEKIKEVYFHNIGQTDN